MVIYMANFGHDNLHHRAFGGWLHAPGIINTAISWNKPSYFTTTNYNFFGPLLSYIAPGHYASIQPAYFHPFSTSSLIHCPPAASSPRPF